MILGAFRGFLVVLASCLKHIWHHFLSTSVPSLKSAWQSTYSNGFVKVYMVGLAVLSFKYWLTLRRDNDFRQCNSVQFNLQDFEITPFEIIFDLVCCICDWLWFFFNLNRYLRYLSIFVDLFWFVSIYNLHMFIFVNLRWFFCRSLLIFVNLGRSLLISFSIFIYICRSLSK